MKKKGFTLAEVLITLSIIGVVAALTIPAVTRKFEKQQWKTGYKEAASIILNATKMIIAEDGTLRGTWNLDKDDIYLKYLPYLKTAKGCRNVDSKGSCFASSYTRLDGSSTTIPVSWHSVKLSNGISISYETPATDYFVFYIDMNGTKGPNVYGKDLNGFTLYLDTGGYRINSYYLDAGHMEESCPSDLKSCVSGCGGGCGHRILRGDYGEDY